MILKVSDLTDEVRRVEFRAEAAALNRALAGGKRWVEQRFDEDLSVRGEVYRHGTDVHFAGEVGGSVCCTCPRCLDDFLWVLARRFRFLIVKAEPGRVVEDDAGLDHYDGDEVDLGRLAVEQALLALDDSVLCNEECRGLCPKCGVNRNHEECACERRP